MFRILSRDLKQRTGGSIPDNVHFMAQGGEASLSLIANEKRTGETVQVLGKAQNVSNSISPFEALATLLDACVRQSLSKPGAIKLQYSLMHNFLKNTQ